jgi:hypothetical protein
MTLSFDWDYIPFNHVAGFGIYTYLFEYAITPFFWTEIVHLHHTDRQRKNVVCDMINVALVTC